MGRRRLARVIRVIIPKIFLCFIITTIITRSLLSLLTTAVAIRVILLIDSGGGREVGVDAGVGGDVAEEVTEARQREKAVREREMQHCVGMWS